MKCLIGVTVLCLLTLLGCASLPIQSQEDAFYDKARLIMMPEEQEIYLHLPDKDARMAFIEEFWEKRNPNPGSEQNEARIEFDRRIELANRYFRENRRIGMGWNTDRGRILLMIGEPDTRQLIEVNRPGLVALERWVYYEYQFTIDFSDKQGYGEFRIDETTMPATELLSAIERSGLLLSKAQGDRIKHAFTFTAKADKKQIIVSIPVKRIRFVEQNDHVLAQFSIVIFVYHDYVKVDQLKLQRAIDTDKKTLIGQKTIDLIIPYMPTAKGKFFFDLIIEETSSKTKSRNFAKFSK